MRHLTRLLPDSEPAAVEFLPPLLRLQASAPHPLGHRVLWLLASLLASLILWSLLGHLDIVAVAEGKLVPHSYLRIVQPAEAGIVKEILVREGESVQAGQVLMRMDPLITEADARSIEADWQRRRLSLRRIDAELGALAFTIEAGDPPALAAEMAARQRANRDALEAALDEERSRLRMARADLAAAQQVAARLREVLPHYRKQDLAFEKLARDGYSGQILASDKKRERIEKEQELSGQLHLVEAGQARIAQSKRRLAQIEADYRRQLHAERNEAQGAFDTLTQELTKQSHRQDLLELKATHDSVVKELATHSVGTVVQPGSVLLTLVPQEQSLRAEVWISNEDIGFVRPGLPVRIKLAAFPFQKYGMVTGTVEHVSADSADGAAPGAPPAAERAAAGRVPLGYKALVRLDAMHLEMDGRQYPLSPGMQSNAEIKLGTRTVAEYLLSPVRKAWHEAGRER